MALFREYQPRPARRLLTRAAAAVAGSLLLVVTVACTRTDKAASGSGTTIGAPEPEPVATTEVPPDQGTQLFAYNPNIGDCFDRRRTTDGTGRTFILKLGCERPHSFEVFAVVDIPDAAFPGDANLDALGKRQCPRAWTAFVGQPYETSKLGLTYEAPSRGNWNLTLKHALACLLKAPGQDGKLVGSKRDSKE